MMRWWCAAFTACLPSMYDLRWFGLDLEGLVIRPIVFKLVVA
jgi:hypothetical protein